MDELYCVETISKIYFPEDGYNHFFRGSVGNLTESEAKMMKIRLERSKWIQKVNIMKRF